MDSSSVPARPPTCRSVKSPSLVAESVNGSTTSVGTGPSGMSLLESVITWSAGEGKDTLLESVASITPLAFCDFLSSSPLCDVLSSGVQDGATSPSSGEAVLAREGLLNRDVGVWDLEFGRLELEWDCVLVVWDLGVGLGSLLELEVACVLVLRFRMNADEGVGIFDS